MVVAPEGLSTEDHQRDEEDNGTERQGSPLEAEPPKTFLANSHRVQRRFVVLSRPPRRNRWLDRSCEANYVTGGPPLPGRGRPP